MSANPLPPIQPLQCTRCSWVWYPKSPKPPQTCANPHCRSPYFDRPRQTKQEKPR